MKTSEKIIQYIRENNQASGKELVDYLQDITPRAVRKQLKSLLESGQLRKVGKPPKVFYLINDTDRKAKSLGLEYEVIDKSVKNKIDKNYLYISPRGEQKQGWEGFVMWCEKTNQNPIKTAKEYVKTLDKYSKYKQKGFISGLDKLKMTFNLVNLDRLYYIDFYSIERFGKTRIGQLLLYAKQSQDKKLIKSLSDEIHPKLLQLVKRYDVDGIVFIPPTVKREVQFMKELERNLSLPLPILKVSKIKTEISVPQKTLSKLGDRIENAKHTIVVEDNKKYKNILLIDDAVGSGATLNETAAQIKRKGLCEGKLIGLAITGSFKGFDVISEV
ncbi:MAG TPA: hypothetical protein PLS49_08415 [Candidatus Woesebacteria bacterium]|nr:hypothetical protein [Candidatus Woesebacteria bacterium]